MKAPATMGLNSRQVRFAELLLTGGRGGSPMYQCDAYVAAGYSPNGARGAASKLRHRPAMIEFIKQLQEAETQELETKREAARKTEVESTLASILRRVRN